MLEASAPDIGFHNDATRLRVTHFRSCIRLQAKKERIQQHLRAPTRRAGAAMFDDWHDQSVGMASMQILCGLHRVTRARDGLRECRSGNAPFHRDDFSLYRMQQNNEKHLRKDVFRMYHLAKDDQEGMSVFSTTRGEGGFSRPS